MTLTSGLSTEGRAFWTLVAYFFATGPSIHFSLGGGSDNGRRL
jgi:hypothetical protein